MATVVGVTAQRAQEIEDASVVSASIEGADLVLKTHGGTLINVGRVIPTLFNLYPVGTIYMTDRSENPSNYMGGGTWVRWGKGRVPVGVDESQTEFNIIDKMGGFKTHILTPAQMPSHNHKGLTSINDRYHTHTASVSTDGAHSHTYTAQAQNQDVADGGAYRYNGRAFNTATSTAGDHTHDVSIGSESQTHAHQIEWDGLNQAHPILQPYITVYMWKRTA